MLERTRGKTSASGEALARSIEGILAARRSGAGRVVRLEAGLERADPLRWLSGRPERPRFYWSARDGNLEVAAVGAAEILDGVPDSAGRLPRGSRYYGGLRFDPARDPASEWEGFGSARFFLPRFELVREEGRTVFACNLVLPRDTARSLELAHAARSMNPSSGAEDVWSALPEVVSRGDLPGWAGWAENVRWALSAFSEGGLEKAVLARRVTLELSGELDPTSLLKALSAVSPGCFGALFEPDRAGAFVSASPERLFSVEGTEVTSEAVAGTRPRGISESDDTGLSRELLASEKDLREHEYVRRSIREALGRLCEEVEISPQPEELTLAQGRHLRSPIRGSLRAGVSPRDVLEALHPTPAVGGWPREEALSLIRELEPFDRGWYAGPIGWIGAEGAEFAVGIRSALVAGESAQLFSGNGIVEGSDPASEWGELEGKLGAFAKVLGFGPPRG